MGTYKKSKQFLQHIFFSVSVVLLSVIILPNNASAVWSGTPYAPGATLNPECTPAQSNCTVIPAATSGVNTDITSLTGLTTPLTQAQGGTGLSGVLPVGGLLVGSGTDALSVLAVGAEGQILSVGTGGKPAWTTPVAGTVYGAGSGLSQSSGVFSLDLAHANTWTVAQTFGGGLSLNGRTYTDFAGTGLSVSSGVLQATLGTAIDSTEITDGTITAADVANGSLTLAKLAQSSCATSDIAQWNGTSWSCGAYISNASQVSNTPAGGVVATDVQAAVNELDTKKLAKTLASGMLFIGDTGNTASAVALSGDVTVGSAGVVSIASDAVALGTDTTGNYLAGIAAGTGLAVGGSGGEGATATIGLNLSAVNSWVGKQTFTGGLAVGSGSTVSSLTGLGLSIDGAGNLKVDPSTLTAVSSLASSDSVLVYQGGTAKLVTKNDLFSDIIGGMNYQGTWNANTNMPNLTSACSAGTKGQYYVVATAGTTNLGGIATWNANDWAVCNGTTWQRVQTTNNINSVFGRTGTITAQNGDYGASQITNTAAGTIAAATVQDALNELDTEKIGMGSDASLKTVAVTSGQAQTVALLRMTNNAGSVSMFNSNGTPEGAITSGIGSLAIDVTAGSMYIKTTATGNTGWTQFGASSGCTATGCSFTGTGTNTVDVAGTNGGLALNANGTGELAIGTAGSGALNIGTGTAAKTITVGNTTGATGVVMNAGTGGLTVNANQVLNGTLTHAVKTIANLPSGGSIGAAATTVDAYTSFLINQTSIGQSITLPNPTVAAAGRVAYVTNKGTALFYLHGATVKAGITVQLLWNGSVWTPATSGDCLWAGCTFTADTNLITAKDGADLAVVAAGAGGLKLDTGGVGNITIGNSNYARTVLIGNVTGSSSIQLVTGTGGVSQLSTTDTGTAYNLDATNITTGTGMKIMTNSLTSGNGLQVSSISTGMTGSLVNVTLAGNNSGNTGTLMSLTSTGASSAAKGLRIDTSAGTGIAADISGALALRKGVDYTGTGTQNNVSFGNASTIRLNPASSLVITGIAGGNDGQLLTLMNVSSAAVTLSNQSSSSTAANRIITGTAADLSLAADTTVLLQYDAGSSRWRVVGGTGAGGSSSAASTDIDHTFLTFQGSPTPAQVAQVAYVQDQNTADRIAASYLQALTSYFAYTENDLHSDQELSSIVQAAVIASLPNSAAWSFSFIDMDNNVFAPGATGPLATSVSEFFRVIIGSDGTYIYYFNWTYANNGNNQSIFVSYTTTRDDTSTPTAVTYTPSAPPKTIRATVMPSVNGAFPGLLRVATAGVKRSYLPTSPATTVSMSSITAALANNAIDNTNYTQTWSWNALGNNSGLILNSTDATSTGSLLTVASNTTGVVGNGLVRFNFTGAHGGNGIELGDATATGVALAITTNSLTSGNGLAVVSMSSGMSGDLGRFELLNSGAGNTGNVLKVGVMGGGSAATALNVTNAGTGLTLRLNDDGTYTDTSPFVVDASGNVGIGKVNPTAQLDLAKLTNTNANIQLAGGSDNVGRIIHTGTGALSFGSTNTTSGGFKFSNSTQDLYTMDGVSALLTVGINDTREGYVSVMGAGAGSREGGELRIYTAADYDSSIEYYWIDTYNDDFRIGSISGGNRLVIEENGYVSIGSTLPAAARLQVNGDIRLGTEGSATPNNGCLQNNLGNVIAGTCSSDERLKTNVVGMSNVLSRLMQVAPVFYQWNDTAATLYGNTKGVSMTGVLAQDVEKVFPELVTTDEKGYKQVNYSALPLYTMQAIREQQANMQALGMQLDSVNNRLAALEAKVSDEAISATSLAALAKANAVSIQGDLTIGGTLIVRDGIVVNQDTAGTATIAAGQRTVHVAFSTPLTRDPVVTMTPVGDEALADVRSAVTQSDQNGFTISITGPLAKDIQFNWHVLQHGAE